MQGLDQPPLRLLIVEPDWLVADAIENMVRDAGWQVVGPAYTLASAQALARTSHLDGAMVDMSWASQAQLMAVVNLLRRRGVPVLLATAVPSPVPFALDALPILQKPFRHPQLFAAVLDLLQNSSIGQPEHLEASHCEKPQ